MYKSIAIDGPAGAGKSTISKKLANKINFNYLDTGAMYRSFTYYYLSKGIDINDEEKINEKIDDIDFEFDNGHFYIDGKDVSKEIRSKEVTDNVSLVSSYKKVREYMVNLQREIASKSNTILDGRDIGSYVLRDADIKFYLTANPEVRAKRRMKQISDESINFNSILEDINQRDHYDSNREITPLVKADDAILIDSSRLDIHGVIEEMIQLLEENNVI